MAAVSSWAPEDTWLGPGARREFIRHSCKTHSGQQGRSCFLFPEQQRYLFLGQLGRANVAKRIKLILLSSLWISVRGLIGFPSLWGMTHPPSAPKPKGFSKALGSCLWGEQGL